VFIEEGNPDYINDSSIINIPKMQILAQVIKDMDSFREVPYPLAKIEFIQGKKS
jgi:hypothetical protein